MAPRSISWQKNLIPRRRKRIRELLSLGRAVVPSSAASDIVQQLPREELNADVNTRGLSMEHISIQTEVGERCPLLLVREARHGSAPRECMDISNAC